MSEEAMKAVREERLANAKFYRKLLQPLIDQIDRDIKAMEKALDE